MTAATNALLTFSVVGGREELKDKIWNVSPKDTPFINACAKSKVSQTFVEWQTDSLASADGNNAQLEGDAITPASTAQPTRLSNSTQISYKSLSISGTTQATSKAGRASEMAYQITKRQQELSRDQETILTSNQTPVPAAHPSNPSGGTANSTTARKLRPLCAWYATNDVRESGGADGSSSAAATDAGTPVAFSESRLQNCLQLCWTAGGNPDLLMMGAFNKRIFSGFMGNSTRMDEGEDKKVVATTEIYVSDFGTHKAVANRFSRARDVHVLDTEYWEIGTLRPKKVEDLAKDGDADRAFIVTEYTLISRNEAASGIVADNTSS